MEKDINCVWIGESLSIMEKLSILLAIKAGYRVILWTNNFFNDIPECVVQKNIPDNILKPTGFKGVPHGGIPNGGIGSYSHWSDYFAFTVLQETGGHWMQLDLAITAPLNLNKSYAFTGWKHQISPVFMKIPKNSEYAKHMSAVLAPLVAEGFLNHFWDDSMHLMHNYALEFNIYKNCNIITDDYYDCGCRKESPYNIPAQYNYAFIHWSNATQHTSKNIPVVGSLYHKLCIENNLIKS